MHIFIRFSFLLVSPAPKIIIKGKIKIITIVSYIPLYTHLSPPTLGKAKQIVKIIEQIINEKDILIFNFNQEIKYPQKKGYNNLAKATYISHEESSHPPITVYLFDSLSDKTLKTSKFKVKLIVKNALNKVIIPMIIVCNL